MLSTIYSLYAKDIKGNDVSLSDYKGKVVLIVNTATQCGLAPQFKGLEQLYNKYKDDGLVVLGFPSNQFLNQEPGSNEETYTTCQVNFGVTFKLFGKIDVNGPNTDPVFQYLKKELPGFLTSKIKWNFTKFLIDRNGVPYKRYSPITKPEQIEKDIIKLLRKD